MFERLDGGAAAIANLGEHLFVATTPDTLRAELEQFFGPDLCEPVTVEGEELTELIDQLDVSHDRLWIVQNGRVVACIDADPFWILDFGAEFGCSSRAAHARCVEIFERGADTADCRFDWFAFSARLPQLDLPLLTDADSEVPIVWELQRPTTNIGETVRLGYKELRGD